MSIKKIISIILLAFIYIAIAVLMKYFKPISLAKQKDVIKLITVGFAVIINLLFAVKSIGMYALIEIYKRGYKTKEENEKLPNYEFYVKISYLLFKDNLYLISSIITALFILIVP